MLLRMLLRRRWGLPRPQKLEAAQPEEMKEHSGA
jgi:hypothetical protein